MKKIDQFNLGEVKRMFLGHVWCFVAVTSKNVGCALGVAVANERGYCPLPVHWSHSDNWFDMEEYVDELNRDLGWTEDQSMDIVASTIRAQNIAKEAHV